MFPAIQMSQQYGKIGIDADLGEFDIRQPKADMQITTIPAQLDIKQHLPDMQIDSSKARDALTGGDPLAFQERLYSQMPNILLQNIANIVEKGNRWHDIHKPGNTIGNIIFDEIFQRKPEIIHFGPASYDNVDIHIVDVPPQINVTVGGVQTDVQVNKPEITYLRGKLDIYMQQYPSLTIVPPSINKII